MFNLFFFVSRHGYFQNIINHGIGITRLLEYRIVGSGSELIHLDHIIARILQQFFHGGFGIVVPVAPLGLVQVGIEITVRIVYESITTWQYHPVDISKIFRDMLLRKERKRVPTEYEVTTVVGYVRTGSSIGGVKSQ